MTDIIPVNSGFIKDPTMADTLITVFNEAPGENVNDYKTRIPPLVIQPGMSNRGGLDVRCIDLTGITRPQWEQEYRSLENEVSIWQKLSLGTRAPVQSTILIGDSSPESNSGNGGPTPDGFSSIDATDEVAKILVTNLPNNAVYVIEV